MLLMRIIILVYKNEAGAGVAMLKFGVLTTPVWGRETDPRVQLAQHQELVQMAEQLGFNAMVAGQHFLGSELRYYQPVPYLTYLSRFAPSMQVTIGLILLSLVNPVETAEQVALLQSMDCSLAQGYYFGAPAEASKAEEFIIRQLAAKSKAA